MAADASRADSARAALRHDPDGFTSSFPARAVADLPYDPAAFGHDLPVMLDTNAYVDQLKGKLPAGVARFILGRPLLHCSIALQEIAISIGIMDPAHPTTRLDRPPLLQLLENILQRDCVAPSAAAWMEGGMLAGILARTQLGLARPKATLTPDQRCCQRGERRKVLNDALIFLTAQEQGAVLVTANRRDMDVLLRLGRGANILLYQPGAPWASRKTRRQRGRPARHASSKADDLAPTVILAAEWQGIGNKRGSPTPCRRPHLLD